MWMQKVSWNDVAPSRQPPFSAVTKETLLKRAAPRRTCWRQRGQSSYLGSFGSPRGPGRRQVRVLTPHPPEARTMATIPARTASGRRCQTAASSVSSGAIASASMRLPNRSAWSAVASATPPPKTALLRPLPPTLWPSGEPAVNDCPDTAVIFVGERVPVIDHVLEVGGKCAGICAA